MISNRSKVRSLKKEIRTTEKDWEVVEWYSEQLGIPPATFAYQAFIKGMREMVASLKQEEQVEGIR